MRTEHRQTNLQLGSYLYLPAARSFTLFRWFAGYRIYNREYLATIKNHGTWLVVANHTSGIDSFLISSLFSQRICWVTNITIHQREYFTEKIDHSLPWLPCRLRLLLASFCAHVIQNCDTVLVDRTQPKVSLRALGKAASDLRAGKLVGIFPEGGIRHKLTKPSLTIPTLLLHQVPSVSGIVQIHVCHQKREITIYSPMSRDEILDKKRLTGSAQQLIISRLQGESLDSG